MARKAIIVINTDYMDAIERDPDIFVELLRTAIIKPSAVREFGCAMGIRYVDVMEDCNTHEYEIGPRIIGRIYREIR